MLGSFLAAFALIAILATASWADAATTIGPLELSGQQAIQVPAVLSLQQSIVHGPVGAAYGTAGRGAPASTSEIVITKKVDKSSPILAQAVSTGKHFKTGSLVLQKEGVAYEAICMVDVFPISVQVSAASGSSETPTETLSLGYSKIKFAYSAGANCGGISAPPIESTLVRVSGSGSKLTERLDCLAAKCDGIAGVSLPAAACPGPASTCSYTGGVRVGSIGGRVRFNHDGTAFTGGVKVGIGGAGKFSMGDGSVRVLQLAVPQGVRKWLKAHSHAKIVSWIVERGVGRAILDRELIGAPAKIESAIPSLSASEPPGEAPLLSQSLQISTCSQPVIGAPPTVVAVGGSLTPARGGATVRLTYTPVNGPPPLPSPIVDSVTTGPTGAFEEAFDRRRNGSDYGWEVVAATDQGDGYAAATSAPCSIPIP